MNCCSGIVYLRTASHFIFASILPLLLGGLLIHIIPWQPVRLWLFAGQLDGSVAVGSVKKWKARVSPETHRLCSGGYLLGPACSALKGRWMNGRPCHRCCQGFVMVSFLYVDSPPPVSCGLSSMPAHSMAFLLLVPWSDPAAPRITLLQWQKEYPDGIKAELKPFPLHLHLTFKCQVYFASPL